MHQRQTLNRMNMVMNIRKPNTLSLCLAKEAHLNQIKHLQSNLQKLEKNRRKLPKIAEILKALKRSYNSENLYHKQMGVSLVHKHRAIHRYHKCMGLPSSSHHRNLICRIQILSRLMRTIPWDFLTMLLPKTRS